MKAREHLPGSQPPGSETVALYLLPTRIEPTPERFGLAKRFPLHLTIRGRFLVRPGELASVAREVARGLPKLPAFRAELRGPLQPREDLWWYEILPGHRGFATARQAHELADTVLAEHGLIVRDLTPSAYKGTGFRPHITVSFSGLTPGDVERAPGSVRAVFSHWAVHRYHPRDGLPREVVRGRLSTPVAAAAGDGIDS